MRNFKLIILVVVALALCGCAKDNDKGLHAYKKSSAEQIFTQAKNNMDARKYDLAAQDLDALDALYPYGKYSQQAQLDIVYAYYMDDEYDSAVAAADRYIHLYPRSKGAGYAYYLKGLAYFDQNKTMFSNIYVPNPAERDLSTYKEAFTAFDELIKTYPKSPYDADARNRMIFIRKVIARHELEVAQFYMKREAYVAAANRASGVVAHYQGTPYVEDALKIMVEAYTALGAKEQAQEAEKQLAKYS